MLCLSVSSSPAPRDATSRGSSASSPCLRFENMTVVEVQASMMCECDLHSNGFSGEHEHRVPPPAVNDAGTQRVRRASARSIKYTKLSAVHVNRMGGLHAHRVRQILELPELRRTRGNGFLWGDIGHGKRAATK